MLLKIPHSVGDTQSSKIIARFSNLSQESKSQHYTHFFESFLELFKLIEKTTVDIVTTFFFQQGTFLQCNKKTNPGNIKPLLRAISRPF